MHAALASVVFRFLEFALSQKLPRSHSDSICVDSAAATYCFSWIIPVCFVSRTFYGPASRRSRQEGCYSISAL